METQDWLQDAGIPWYGNPWNSTSTKMSREKLTNDKSPIATVVTKNGIKVAFVGYHSFQLGIDRVIAEIKRVSGPDVFTIVVPHWGEEYTATSSEKMRSQAKAFIAAGADAIIGAHPHVVMNQEWMNGVPVVYSVGNLLFDQYFSPQVMTGNIIELHVSKDASGVHLESMNVHENYLIKGKGVSLEQ
jgi:poly-gamma-glutamate synthesis protein (capsule biosynthesis protein)